MTVIFVTKIDKQFAAGGQKSRGRVFGPCLGPATAARVEVQTES